VVHYRVLEGVRGPIPAEALTLSNYKAPKIMKAISLKQPWASLVASGKRRLKPGLGAQAIETYIDLRFQEADWIWSGSGSALHS
jgi:hypothetical protein